MADDKRVKKTGLSNIVAEWLWNHLQQWTDQGLISEEQKQSIQSLYLWPPHVAQTSAVQKEKSSQQPKKPLNVVLILEIIGAFLIGIGLITFIAFNWPQMGNTLKLALVLALIALIHLIGYWLWRKTKLIQAGQSIIFLGNLAYGAGIWLVAQIYHLPSHFPRGMLVWAIGVLPMAFAIKSKANYFLAVVLFILWTFGESFGFQAPQPLFLIVLLVILVPLSYYLKTKTGLAICIATGGVWLFINNVLWMEGQVSGYLILPLALYGLLLLLLSNLHQRSESLLPYKMIYRYSGAVIFAAAIIIQPFYGVYVYQLEAPVITEFTLSFWLCNGGLLAGILTAWFLQSAKEETPWGAWIRQSAPILLVASLFSLTLPHIRFSILPTLTSVVLLLGILLNQTKSRTVQHLGMVFFPAWLLAVGLAWETPFEVWVLFLFYFNLLYLMGLRMRTADQKDGQSQIYKSLGLLGYFGALIFLPYSKFAKMIIDANLEVSTRVDFWILLAVLTALLVPFIHRFINEPKTTGSPSRFWEEEAILGTQIFLPAFILVATYIIPAEQWLVETVIGLLTALLFGSLISAYRLQQVALKAIAICFITLLFINIWAALELASPGILLIFLLASLNIYLLGWSRRLKAGDKATGQAQITVGLFAYMGLAYTFTFNGYYRSELLSDGAFPTAIVFWVLGLGLAAVTGILLNKVVRAVHPKVRGGLLRSEQVLLIFLALFPWLITGLVQFTPSGHWFVYFTNAFFIFSLITYLLIGYRRQAVYLKSLAAVYIALFVIARYFEMDWSLLYKAILLAATGVVILVVGIVLEKNKDKVTVINA